MKKTKKISYETAGVHYESLDPAKKLAQQNALNTAIHLKNNSYPEVTASRGETAFVWQQGSYYMASVVESLGTKNLVADAMRDITGKTYYDAIGNDTVAAIINDLTAVGANPLTMHAFWAVGDSHWFDDTQRITDLVTGWKHACDIAHVTWGGGETPSYNTIVAKDTIALGGSAVGIIPSKKQLLLDTNITRGDNILFIKSNGINANGISLTRAIATKLPKGYATKLPSGMLFGEAILTTTNIYAQVVQALFTQNIPLHYITNITGHGLRKIMRAKQNFSYVIEKLFEPQEIFPFIQKHAHLSEYEMYHTYNMGQDYALFLPEKHITKAQRIIKQLGFESLHAGHIEKGNKEVLLTEKNIVFQGDTLDLR